MITQEIRKIPELEFCVSGEEEREETIIHYKKDISGNYVTDISGYIIVEFEEKTIVKQPLHLKYNDIFCYNIQATQELDRIIQSQQETITSLQNELQAIKNHLNLN